MEPAILPHLQPMDRCMEWLREHDVAAWDDRDDLISLDGVKVVCKFYDEEGNWIRASTDAMPEDGEAILAKIHAILQEYLPAED